MSDEVVNDVITTVADAKGVDPLELDYSLSEYIDLDAVEQLAAHENASLTLSFELPDHEVTVISNGETTVEAARTNSSTQAPNR